MQLPCNLFVVFVVCFCIVVSVYGQDNINIRVTVDTKSLVQDFTDKPVSQNPNAPTPVGHQYVFMIAPRYFVVSGQTSENLHLKYHPKDFLNWYASSESNNMGNAAIVYYIKHSSECLGKAESSLKNGSKVVPTDPTHIEKITHTKGKYLNLRTEVIKVCKKVDYKLFFGVYVRHYGVPQKLFGYFQLDSSIVS